MPRTVLDKGLRNLQAQMALLLVAPTLTTPLLKIPLLLGNAVTSYYAFTPPRPSLDSNEQEKFTHKPSSDLYNKVGHIQLRITYLLKVRPDVLYTRQFTLLTDIPDHPMRCLPC